MNSLPKYVASTTLSDLTWNATLLQGNLAEALSRLKQEDGQNILVFGSGQLVQALHAWDLIDEYRLMVFPVVLGSGKRLFADGGEMKAFKLVESKPFSSGVVLLTYQSVKD
jgi:dihydrofolate reductase